MLKGVAIEERSSESESTVEAGVLYLVSTPIGNLKDITLRALDILAGVDLIAAEDTRRARILLTHYGITTPTTSYYQYNREKKTPYLIGKLKEGASLAVISEAGTPGISDPAFHLVYQAIQQGIRVVAIPGATAFVPALITSGLATDRFVFEGFLPAKKGRQKRLMQLRAEERTLVFYESPRRILKTLEELATNLGNRRVAVAREITKKFEEVIGGTLAEVLEQLRNKMLRGEFVIVLEGAKGERTRESRKGREEVG